MLGFVKMSALSAVLSFGLVTAYAPSEPSAATGSAKIFQDRIAPDAIGGSAKSTAHGVSTVASGVTGVKGNRLAAGGCGGREWPHFPPECVTRDDGRPMPVRVRVVTIESRDGTNVSVLRREPQTEVAAR